MYKMDMSEEGGRKELLPEGWRRFEITECTPSKSKAGNDMFIIALRDIETNYAETIYPIAVKGKRWFLKQILNACDVEAGQDGIYEWDISDVLNKTVLGLVKHIEEDWVNREGVTVKSRKVKIAQIENVSNDKEAEAPEAPF